MKRLSEEELKSIRLRLNGSTTGPWGPSHTTAKECGGRYTGNLLLDHIAWLANELEKSELKLADVNADRERLRLALERIYKYRSDAPDWNMVMAIADDALNQLEAVPSKALEERG